MRVFTNQPLGEVPVIFAPSFGVTFMDAASRAAVLEAVPRFGTVSFSLDWAAGAAQSPADYLRIARDSLRTEVLPFVQRGATAVIGIAGSPRYLSARPDLLEPDP